MAFRDKVKEILTFGSNASIAAAMLVMIACTVISSLAGKAMYTAFGSKYTFFRYLNSNLLYDIWCLSVLLIGLRVSPTQFRLSRKKLTWFTWSEDSFPITYLGICAFLDSFSGFLGTVSGLYTPGPWMVLLGQTQVFFIMILATFILKQRYNWIQVFGAVAVVVGVCMAIFPVISGCDAGSNCRWYSVMIYGLSNVPYALSVTLKERAFKSAGLNVFFLTSVVSWTQVALTWMFLPLQQLPGFGGIPWSEIPSAVSQGFLCFMGDTSIPVYNNGALVGYCSPYTTRVTFLFSFSDFFAGILQLSIIKYGSASASVIALAVATPLADLLFSWHELVGINYTPITYYNIIGLFTVVTGFLAYNYPDLMAKKPPKSVDGPAEAQPLLQQPDNAPASIGSV